MDPALHLACRLGLAALFATAAAHKLRDLPSFQSTLAAYRIVPARLTRVVAMALPGAEVIVAAALFGGMNVEFGAAAAVVLLALYSGAIGINLVRGRVDIDCGCGIAATPLGPLLLLRNAGLICVALVAVVPVTTARPPVWLDGFTAVAATACTAMLLAGVDAAASNRRLAALRQR